MTGHSPTPEITKELSPGEKLLWSGRPAQGVKFRGNDFFLVPFSLLWCGFAIFWEFSVYQSNAPFMFKLWGVPFVTVGMYIVLGRFFADAAQRAKTFYAVTNERIIIVTNFFGNKTKTLNLRTLSDVSLSEKPGGEGTVTFGPTNPMFAFLGNSSWPGMSRNATPCFDSIENARTVYGIVMAAQKTEWTN